MIWTLIVLAVMFAVVSLMAALELADWLEKRARQRAADRKGGHERVRN